MHSPSSSAEFDSPCPVNQTAEQNQPPGLRIAVASQILVYSLHRQAEKIKQTSGDTTLCWPGKINLPRSWFCWQNKCSRKEWEPTEFGRSLHSTVGGSKRGFWLSGWRMVLPHVNASRRNEVKWFYRPAAGVPLVSVVSKELRTHWVNLLEMGPISTLKKEPHLLKAWELTLFGEPFSGSRNILGSHLDKENCGCLPGWICPQNNGTGSSNWVFLGSGLLACQDNNQL